LFDQLWRDRRFAASADGRLLLRPLALVVGARGRKDEIGVVLTALASGESDDATTDMALGLGDGLARSRLKLQTFRDSSPAGSAGALWLERPSGRAEALAPDGSASPERRAQAILIIGRGTSARAGALLPRLLDPQEPPQVQAAAARALASFDRP